jgi:hypothetical protein
MMKQATIVGSIALASCLALGVSAANAQATRSYVSGVGDDANPCSRTAPCKTFAGAIGKTATGGEIDCLDSGGFGAVAIGKSITIDCTASGLIGGVVPAAATGISIIAPGGNIVLIGLDISASGGNSRTGIAIGVADHVTISDCIVYGFNGDGIDVEPTTIAGLYVDIIRTKVFDNAASGIFFKPTGGASIRGAIVGSQVSNNGNGGNGDGISINDNVNTISGSVKIVVSNTQSLHNGSGNGFAVFSSTGGVAEMAIDSSVASDNNADVGVTGANATVRFTRTMLSAGTAVSNSGGTVVSYSTNMIDGAVVGTLTTVASQ